MNGYPEGVLGVQGFPRAPLNPHTDFWPGAPFYKFTMALFLEIYCPPVVLFLEIYWSKSTATHPTPPWEVRYVATNFLTG